MDERYFSLGDAAETLSASIFDSEGNRMPSQKMFIAMQDAFVVGALTFYDEYRNPIDLDALKRQKWEFISLYDRDSNHLGLYGETTTPKAINAWLESTGSPHRFPTANSASETQAAPVVAASGGPAPLITNDIASCFAGLDGWDFKRWKKELSTPDGWLKDCQQRVGTRGRPYVQSTWFPVLIGAALVTKGVPVKSVSARFKGMEPLQPWRDAWSPNDPDSF